MDGGRVPTLRKEAGMSTGSDQGAELKFVVTNTLIVRDIKRSVAFYRDVLGATVLREGEPTFLRLANIWLTINGGGGALTINLTSSLRRRPIPMSSATSSTFA
jgi:catechol-2,3-dioxygenase